MIPNFKADPICNTDPEAALAEVERRIRETGHTYLGTGQFGALERLPTNLADTVDDQIDLSRTNVSDISGLACLPGLKQLTLSKLVTDIAVVGNLPDLESLGFCFTTEVDISPLVACRKLARITNLAATHASLALLGELESLKYLGGLRVAAGQDVPHMPNLTSLTLVGPGKATVETDLTFLAASQNLEFLWGEGQRGYNFPKRMDNLKFLSMTLRDGEDLGIVARYPRLEQLSIRESDVSDLSMIPAESQLQELDLSGTKVSDIRGLDRLPRLKSISLDDTPVEDIVRLSDSLTIKRVSVKGSKVKTLKGWSANANLSSLNVSNTGFDDLRPLAGTRLGSLFASDTPLADLTGLSEIRGLSTLVISGTKVAAIPPLEANAWVLNIPKQEQFDWRESIGGFEYKDTPLAESGWKANTVPHKASGTAAPPKSFWSRITGR
jgi:Leucine-rich repeat (LRR) protein